MNKDLLKIDNYYIGFIQLNPFVYNRDNARRMLNDINYDPFCETNPLNGMIEGAIVLLRKEGDIFYDEYSSRYRNEIKLKLGTTDKHGIRLVYVKKFTDIYKDNPPILVKEDIEKDLETIYELTFEYNYYISYSKLNKTYTPITLDDDAKMYDVREEFYEIFYRQPLINQEKIKK